MQKSDHPAIWELDWIDDPKNQPRYEGHYRRMRVKEAIALRTSLRCLNGTSAKIVTDKLTPNYNCVPHRRVDLDKVNQMNIGSTMHKTNGNGSLSYVTSSGDSLAFVVSQKPYEVDSEDPPLVVYKVTYRHYGDVRSHIVAAAMDLMQAEGILESLDYERLDNIAALTYAHIWNNPGSDKITVTMSDSTEKQSRFVITVTSGGRTVTRYFGIM